MATCEHLARSKPIKPRGIGCEECIQIGSDWVHLRTCLTCGHVGCCDSSLHKHATQHFHATQHPVVASKERGEHWRWCYIDEQMAE